MEKQVAKQNLTIKISRNTYHQLKSDIGKGKMSDFIERLITKELGGTEKRIEQEYRECYANPRMLKEAKQWEQAEIASWLNYERNKRVNHK
jgi:predicted CopG family antitoxin